MQKKLKVLAFGTFDLLHEGHEFYLREAKKLGNKLAVIVARDLNVWRAKGYLPKQGEKERLRAVKKLKFVNRAFHNATKAHKTIPRFIPRPKLSPDKSFSAQP